MGPRVTLCASARGVAARHLVLNSSPAASFIAAEVHALTAAGAELRQARALFRRLQDAVRNDADLATAARVMIADEQDPLLREVIERSGFELTNDSYSQLRAWAPTVRGQVFAGADHRVCLDGALAPG